MTIALPAHNLAWASDLLEYPRTVEVGDHRLEVHHPVIEQWPGFTRVEGWIPVEVWLGGDSTPWVGAVRAEASTQVDFEKRQVVLSDQRVRKIQFSQSDAPEAAFEAARAAIRSQPQVIMLDTLLSALAADFQVPLQRGSPSALNDAPPRIIVSSQPVQLLLVDQQPVTASISGTELEVVVNTDWNLFRHTPSNTWYVLNQGYWQSHSMLATGGWNTTTDVPADFRTLALGDEWKAVRDALPPQLPESEPVPFVISLEPAELVQIDGEPRLEPIGEGGLSYVANTDRKLFELDGNWFLLAAGRWFVSDSPAGKWRSAGELPAAFREIPESHPRAAIRAAVPGTIEAKVAMMKATLPRPRWVSEDRASGLEVGYVGPPQFVPIEGTGVARAVNSPHYVFLHNNFYYLCHDAAWFMSSQPVGPWSVAHSVPEAIYRIPSTDPAYFVTFVHPAQATPREGKFLFQHNAGYLGEFSTGVSVVQGTGWYYSPWIWYDPAGRPVYWSHPYTYGWHGWGYGPGSHRLYHYGGYWGARTVNMDSAPVGIGGGEYDAAFSDPRLARPGYDYTTIQQQREAALGRTLNADDDYYADSQGNVYRQQNGEWSRHTADGWNTMAELERMYGSSGDGTVGQVEASDQRQAYRQNPNDIERIKRWHERRSRSYNMYGYVSVYH